MSSFGDREILHFFHSFYRPGFILTINDEAYRLVNETQKGKLEAMTPTLNHH